MKIVKNARALCLRAWSMWANYLGIVCLIAPEAIYAFAGVDTDPAIWWWAGLGLIVTGIVGRLVDQGIDHDTTRSPAIVGVLLLAGIVLYMWDDIATPAPKPQPVATELAQSVPAVRPVARPGSAMTAEAATLAVAVPLIARWEGLKTEAYQDIVGVWTVCYGETRGVKAGDRYTEAECRAMLRAGVAEYRAGLHTYFTPETRAARLTPERDAAYTSLAYNVGIAGAGKSTATRRLNAGDIAGGCEAIGWWNKAGGRVVRGLVNRRAEEVALCLRGLT